MQPRHAVQKPDETPEQAVAIKIAREHLDAPPFGGARRHLPIGARFRIQPVAKIGIEQIDIGAAGRVAKKAEETFMVR